METVLTYRGYAISDEDVAAIRALIAAHPGASRRQLSKLLCEAWDWRQPNGALRDMLARSLMLALARAGHITLPPVRARPPNNVVARRTPTTSVALDRTPLRSSLAELEPLSFDEVRATATEALVDALITEHHYLGAARGVGTQLKYLVSSGLRPLACLTFTSAPRHLGPRDRFIGWSPEARWRRLHHLAYNTRFVILPWIEVPHLASHVLGRVARRISADCRQRYGYPLYYLESFVEPERFSGTCYRAANWQFLGLTTGRGKDDHTKRANRPLKAVLGYPLTRHFRALLGVAARGEP